MRFGLLGRHLQHSYSPRIHELLGRYSYALMELEPSQLEAYLRAGNFQGINVTIPYKKDVIPYLDMLSPEASRLGAVNTIIRHVNGTLVGHNSDYFGFHSMLTKTGYSPVGKKALVLGSGGASNTVCAVLQELGAQVVVISRCGTNNYGNLHLHTDAALIVNATPVGMYPNVSCSPVDLSVFPHAEAVLDLIYNPARTQLLMDARAHGLIAANGLWMLVAQAKESAQWFIGESIPDSQIDAVYRKMRLETENLIFIGMPGCGKTTVGSRVASALSRPFVDIDEKVAEEAGCSISEIFSTAGESAFRQLETSMLERYGKESGLVISTGGGCVTNPENYRYLHQNGTIVWLTRDLELLAIEGRPLSQAQNLSEMYAQRAPLYAHFADVTVCNNGTIQTAVSSVLHSIEGAINQHEDTSD